MEKIADVLNANIHSLENKRYEKNIAQELNPKTVAIINRLFVVFESICRGFEKQYSDNQKKLNLEKIQWTRAFMDAGISTIEQLEFGIKKCRLESPINTPTIGQFVKWCAPEPKDLGLPTVEEAYKLSLLINRQFSDYKPDCAKTYTVIKHAISQIGPSEYRSMKADTAFKTFERYYAITFRQFVEGRLSEIPLAISEKPLPHPIDRERANEARLRAMEAIRNMGISVTRRA